MLQRIGLIYLLEKKAQEAMGAPGEPPHIPRVNELINKHLGGSADSDYKAPPPLFKPQTSSPMPIEPVSAAQATKDFFERGHREFKLNIHGYNPSNPWPTQQLEGVNPPMPVLPDESLFRSGTSSEASMKKYRAQAYDRSKLSDEAREEWNPNLLPEDMPEEQKFRGDYNIVRPMPQKTYESRPGIQGWLSKIRDIHGDVTNHLNNEQTLHDDLQSRRINVAHPEYRTSNEAPYYDSKIPSWKRPKKGYWFTR